MLTLFFRQTKAPPAAMSLFICALVVLQVSLLWTVVIGFDVRRGKGRRRSCKVSFGQENGLSFGGREAGGRKRPSKGAAAAGKFEEKADFSTSRSKRDMEVEANRNDLLERLGLEDYEDEFASGSDLRKGRKDAARLDRKKEAKKAKLAEKKRVKELGVFLEDDDMELSWQERATAVWEDLCLHSAFLLPEEMGNQLILQEDDECDENQSGANGGGSLRRLWTQEHVLSGGGYLDILRSFYTGGKILPGEGEEEEEEGFFLFALAALFASLDGFPPLLEKRGALDLPGYLLHDAWQGGNYLDICRRYDLLQSALSSWSIGRSSVKGEDIEAVSSRHVGLEGESFISMHDALKAGMLTAALRALQSSIDGDENDNDDDNDVNDRITQCTTLLKGLLQRQAHAFLRVHRSASHQNNSVSGEGLIASTAVLLKLAKMMVCTSGCIDSAKPPTSLLNLANERAERFDGAYMTAKQLCSSCGIYTEKIARRGSITQDGSVCAVLSGCEGLRRIGAFRLPLSPFLDKHGQVLATHPLLGKEDLRAIVSALINRLSAQTAMIGEDDVDKLGCCRLLAGITSVLPLSEIEKRFDKTTRRAWRALLEERSDGGMLRRALDMSSRDFAEELARRAAI